MRLDGLVPAAFTPFHDDGSLALERVGPMLEYYRSRPIAALFVCGTTGECSGMTDDERFRTADAFVRDAGKNLPIIVHAGASSVESARLFAAHAQDIGAYAVAATSPYYQRPATPDLLVDSLARIAAGAPKLPFYYYHIPSCTGVTFAVAPLVERIRGKIPNFAGVKFTHEDLMDFQGVVEACGDTAEAFFGRDETLLAALALGATGAVGSTYNYAARLYDTLIAAFRKGDIVEARRLQRIGQRMIGAMLATGGNAGKLGMKLAGVDVGPCRLPAARLSPAEEERYRAELDAVGFLSWL